MNDDDWIKRRVADAKTNRPLLPGAVLTRVEELLRGELRDAQLSRRQLTTVARNLLGKMGSGPTKDEVDP